MFRAVFHLTIQCIIKYFCLDEMHIQDAMHLPCLEKYRIVGTLYHVTDDTM